MILGHYTLRLEERARLRRPTVKSRAMRATAAIVLALVVTSAGLTFSAGASSAHVVDETDTSFRGRTVPDCKGGECTGADPESSGCSGSSSVVMDGGT